MHHMKTSFLKLCLITTLLLISSIICTEQTTNSPNSVYLENIEPMPLYNAMMHETKSKTDRNIVYFFEAPKLRITGYGEVSKAALESLPNDHALCGCTSNGDFTTV